MLHNSKKLMWVLSLTLLTLGGWGYSESAFAEDAQAAVDTAALGDLSGYKTMANDVIAALKDKDADKAKTKVTEIETAWSKDEKSLSAQSPQAWEVVNKAFTQAATLVKSNDLDFDKAREAMDNFLKTITK